MARTSTTSGNWSSNATWVEGSPPTATDAVTIAAGHTVTIDNTSAVALSVTLNNGSSGAGGKLQPSTTANSKLTVEQGITANGTTTGSGAYSSNFAFDMSANSYACEIVLNNANTGTYNCRISGNFQLKGKTRKRHTTLSSGISAGATSATVADATGWAIGDTVVFATTSAPDNTARANSSAISWSGGYLTFPATDTSPYTAGGWVILSGFAPAGLNKAWQIFDVTASTNFRIAMSDPGAITDSAGFAQVLPKTDEVVLTSCNTGTGVIGWSGGIAYAHASGAPVGSFSSNLIFTGSQTAYSSVYTDSAAAAMSANGVVTDVLFRYLSDNNVFPYYGSFAVASTANSKIASVSNNAFYGYKNTALGAVNVISEYVRDSNIFYSSKDIAAGSWVNSGNDSNSNYYNIGPDTTPCVFLGSGGFRPLYANQNVVGAKISGLILAPTTQGRSAFVATGGQKLIDSDVWSCRNALSTIADVENCRFGDQVFTNCNNESLCWPYQGEITIADSLIQSANVFIGFSSGYPNSKVWLKNKNDLPDAQEIYGAHSNTQPIIKKSTSIGERSTSSFEFQFNSTTLDVTREFDIPVKAATAVRIIVFVKKDANYYAAAYDQPTTVLSGLGITPVTATATAASNNAWERLIVDLAAGSAPSVDGNLKLTLRGKSATAGAKCWFSGVPNAPFITRCRHYGYIFDEATATRTRNNTVTLAATDPALPTSAELTSAESAAYGITGISVTGGTSTSPVTISASKTFQQLYDYTQAWCANSLANVGYAVPVEGSGANGSPSLLAKANITISATFKLNGNGSLNIGSYTLSTEFAGGSAYTYTGGTWSQATTVPTFAGGTLNIGAAGTYTYTQAAAMVLSMTPTAPGTYTLGDSTFAGQVDLRNTSGTHAITVELPSGTSYTTANNTGATITVTLPSVVADISITGMPNAGAVPTRLQIFNSTALSAAAWQATTAYSAGAIRLRSTGVGTENTAGLYMRCTTAGTSGGTEPTWNTTPGGTTNDGTVVWTTYKVLFYDADPASTSYATTYTDGNEFLAGETVKIRFAEMNAGTSFKRYSTSLIAAASGFSADVDEAADEVFATNALDGSAYETTFSPNFTSNYIVLDTNTDFAGKAAYAYFCYTLTTSNGMYKFWGGVTALDVGNYRIETDILNLYFDESAGFVKQTDDVRIFRKDGTRPALDPTTGGNGIEMNWRTPVSVVSTGGSALTPTESAKLMGLPSANMIAQEVVSGITF